MKIYLINPRFPSRSGTSPSVRTLRQRVPVPALSLATLAGLTPGGHELAICDENVRPVDVQKDADLVGITGYHIQKEQVFHLADAFRKRGVTVAIGGPLVQRQNLDECLLHADAVFLGEAEYTGRRSSASFRQTARGPSTIKRSSWPCPIPPRRGSTCSTRRVLVGHH